MSDVQLDHLILSVNDIDESVRFYTEILGLTHEGQREPFTVIRVTPDLTLQLAPWGSGGGEHLAFAPPGPTSMRRSSGSRLRASSTATRSTRSATYGPGHPRPWAIVMFDPSKHLIEIRHYD